MITADQIASFRTAAVDYDDTRLLKQKLADQRCERKPLYLTLEEFEEIARWKLGQQSSRQGARRQANTEEVIRSVTGLALTITHPDPEYELELRLGILWALPGVGIAVASAILALVFPNEYAPIDYRVWRQLFSEEKRGFSISNYKKYISKLRYLADELGWPVQEVDHAIWEYDSRNGWRA